MLLVGSNGTRFELEIVGYQFPELEDDPWDANWLMIRIAVVSADGAWTSTDPSLLTSDVEGLALWLDAVSEFRATYQRVQFLEPNLAFELQSESPRGLAVRVLFEQESRPPWARPDPPSSAFFVDLALPHEAVREAAEALRLQLVAFPPRATRS
jgi:hypothetical protein